MIATFPKGIRCREGGQAMLGAPTTNDSDISEGNALSGGRTSYAWSTDHK